MSPEEEQSFIERYKILTETNKPWIGTRRYVRTLHQIAKEGKDFPRQDDLEISLITLYIEHYMQQWEDKHPGQKFNSNDIFKIRLPKWIKLVENSKE